MHHVRRNRLALVAVLAGLLISTGWAKNAQAGAPNTWITVAPMPDGRWFPAAASADGKLYVFGGGGCSTNFCETFDAYDPATNTWTSMGDMPVVLGGLPSATAGSDGHIYIYGWTSSIPGTRPAPTPSGSTLLIYDPRVNTWTQGTPPPSVDDSAILVTGLGGQIYAVGGRVNGSPVGSLSAYDPRARTWTALKPLPIPRQSPGVAAGPDGRIYVIGGTQIGSSSPRADLVDAYDPRTNSWSSVANLPTARAELEAVTGPDGRIYTLGGGAGSRCFTSPCTVVEAYEVKPNRWTAIASLPHPRWGSAATVGPDGRIYVVGGAKSIGGGPLDLETAVDAYTVVSADQPLPRPTPGPTAVTRELAPMPTGREGLAVVSSGGKIYAVGGQSIIAPRPGSSEPPNPTALRTVEAYAPGTDRWATQPPLPAPRVGAGAATGPDGRIYVLGGAAVPWEQPAGSLAIVGLRTVFIYDPTTRQWSRGTPMPDGRYAFAAVTGKDGRIYTIGGAAVCYPGGMMASRITPEGQPARRPAQLPGGPCVGTQTVHAFDPRTNRWATLTPLPTGRLLPATAVGPDGRIYVFGGNLGDPPMRSFDVYDPRDNRWTRLTGMRHMRFSGFAAASEGDGRIDVIGGCVVTRVTSNGGFSSVCGAPSPVDRFDPRTKTWQTIGLTLNSRIASAATTGPDGRVYVVGGAGDGNGRLLEVIRSGRRKG